MRTRRIRWWSGILGGMTLFGLVIYYYFSSINSYYRTVSPNGDGIVEFAGRIEIKKVTRCENGEDVYYVLSGVSPPGYVLASGPPVYVFDKKGDLLEWVEDSGEQPKVMEKWVRGSCKDTTIEQAIKEIQEGSDTP